MTRFRFDTKEGICWKALNGEMSLSDAAAALVHLDSGMEDPFSSIYPEAEILEEMLNELRQNPTQRDVIESKFRERATNAFHELLDIFTTPDIPHRQPNQYCIPKSTAQERS